MAGCGEAPRRRWPIDYAAIDYAAIDYAAIDYAAALPSNNRRQGNALVWWI